MASKTQAMLIDCAPVQAHEQGHHQLSCQCTHSVMVVRELDGWDVCLEPLGRTAVQSAVYDVVNAVAREGMLSLHDLPKHSRHATAPRAGKMLLTCAPSVSSSSNSALGSRRLPLLHVGPTDEDEPAAETIPRWPAAAPADADDTLHDGGISAAGTLGSVVLPLATRLLSRPALQRELLSAWLEEPELRTMLLQAAGTSASGTSKALPALAPLPAPHAVSYGAAGGMSCSLSTGSPLLLPSCQARSVPAHALSQADMDEAEAAYEESEGPCVRASAPHDDSDAAWLGQLLDGLVASVSHMGDALSRCSTKLGEALRGLLKKHSPSSADSETIPDSIAGSQAEQGHPASLHRANTAGDSPLSYPSCTETDAALAHAAMTDAAKYTHGAQGRVANTQRKPQVVFQAALAVASVALLTRVVNSPATIRFVASTRA